MENDNNKDLYEILQIKKDASIDVIKSAYRHLARLHHPDINESEESKKIFKEIRFAYDILSNPQKKKIYDLKNGFNQKTEEPKNILNETNAEEKADEKENNKKKSSEKNFSQLLNDILNGIFVYAKHVKKKKEKSLKGDDIFANVTISTKEALIGTSRIINIMQTNKCPNCQGKKFINEALCPLCKGSGEITSHKRINAKIPPNTKDEDKIKIEGAGNQCLEGVSGDLYLIIKVDEKSLFNVKDDVVYMDLPITTFEAALGANIKIPTIYEDIIIKIPPNTSSGQRFRLSSQGIYNKEDGIYGDMIVTVYIKLPKKLSDKEIRLYNELKNISNFDVREGLKSDE